MDIAIYIYLMIGLIFGGVGILALQDKGREIDARIMLMALIISMVLWPYLLGRTLGKRRNQRERE